MTFEAHIMIFLSKGNHDTIHVTNLRKLIIKVHKCLNGDAPGFLLDYFTKIDTLPYDLRRYPPIFDQKMVFLILIPLYSL